MRISELYSIFKLYPKICTNSREITANCIFFALRGQRFNGNKFAEDAIKKGAAYAVIDQKEYKKNKNTILVKNTLNTLQDLAKYHREKLKIPVLGITGTNGKTTSKELISCVLKSKKTIYSTKGNLNNHIGVPLSILEINNKHEIAIIEMGANKQKEIDFLCEIAKPTYGVITNIGLAHLKGFKNIDGVTKTKIELYKYLRKNNGHVFVNYFDKKLNVLSEGINKTIYGEKYKIHENNNMFMNLKYKNTIYKSQLVGKYQAHNISLAITIGKYFNIPEINIQSAILNYIPSNNRSQIIKTKHNTIILDAYNANPSSMNAMIKSFAEQNKENKICILGDMLELGQASKEMHKQIIALTNQLKIQCIFVGNEFYSINKSSYKNVDFLTKYFKKNPLKNQTILIKGSRGIALEKIVNYL
ncbi:MAG: UDP-N-acetylmuramoyl-tripeptide--D-alanyl-D-alanine ligase [Flavobacteriales bacterium]|nr:UDP-N-acetylmuramoyl-tripeptide--D-alanyl-D-alanine ligase [Flavobacteriales bacterium]